jgi:hypothetical protein
MALGQSPLLSGFQFLLCPVRGGGDLMFSEYPAKSDLPKLHEFRILVTFLSSEEACIYAIKFSLKRQLLPHCW